MEADQGSCLSVQRVGVSHLSFEPPLGLVPDERRAVRDVRPGPYAEETIYQMFLSRLADLSEETALCFARIDRVDGDLYYIGRRHVHDENAK
jgi:hypothetical protein